jgi:hypothetical protein
VPEEYFVRILYLCDDQFYQTVCFAGFPDIGDAFGLILYIVDGRHVFVSVLLAPTCLRSEILLMNVRTQDLEWGWATACVD